MNVFEKLNQRSIYATLLIEKILLKGLLSKLNTIIDIQYTRQ